MRQDPSTSVDYGGLKLGFVLVVGLSGGTMALYGDTSPAIVGAATAAGLAIGGALLWYLTWIVS